MSLETASGLKGSGSAITSLTGGRASSPWRMERRTSLRDTCFVVVGKGLLVLSIGFVRVDMMQQLLFIWSIFFYGYDIIVVPFWVWYNIALGTGIYSYSGSIIPLIVIFCDGTELCFLLGVRSACCLFFEV